MTPLALTHRGDWASFAVHSMQASTFDKFAAEVMSSPVYQQLPVITSEIGDTWIHGVASDPIKVCGYVVTVRGQRGSDVNNCVLVCRCRNSEPCSGRASSATMEVKWLETCWHTHAPCPC